MRHGLPIELRFDRGTEFAGEVVRGCEDYGIRRHVIST